MKPVDPVERHLFIEGLRLRYGYDFSGYSEASFDRRLHGVLTKYNQTNLLALLMRALDSKDFFFDLLSHLTINTTEFFRDPSFFKTLREQVVPVLKTYPTLRIWIAGCSSGEEVLSLAILLQEEGLYSRSTIYATDINPDILKKAQKGIYPASSAQVLTKNYFAAGGTDSPSKYYVAEYDHLIFNQELRENIVYTPHNLATDAVFLEAHLILCRNVMIYFNGPLQDRVFRLFTDSLVYGGFLGIGSKETLSLSDSAARYQTIDDHENIFRLNESLREARAPWGGPR